jgi:hypothetical protein
MQAMDLSLEDIFLEVTQNSAAIDAVYESVSEDEVEILGAAKTETKAMVAEIAEKAPIAEVAQPAQIAEAAPKAEMAVKAESANSKEEEGESHESDI